MVLLYNDYKYLKMGDSIMNVAYLGPRGTFTEMAAKILGKGSNFIPYHSFYEALIAVEKGEADEAVVPVENSIEGVVNGTADCLIFDVELYIQELLILPIRQCLIAKNDTALNEITHVLSHPHAIPQCRDFIEKYLPQADIITESSTAEAVRKVSESDEKIAGIGAAAAAELYGLNVLAEGIQNTDNNFTQFVRVSKSKNMDYVKEKVTICFSTNDEPGALYKILDIFSIFDINMSKIASRPMRNRPMEYVFLIDLDVNNNSKDIEDAIKLIERKSSFCKNLGCYDVRDNRLQK